MSLPEPIHYYPAERLPSPISRVPSPMISAHFAKCAEIIPFPGVKSPVAASPINREVDAALAGLAQDRTRPLIERMLRLSNALYMQRSLTRSA